MLADGLVFANARTLGHMDFDYVATTTRAVRKRLDLERPVEREVLEDCLRIAIQAPTGSNSEATRFVVVTDPGKRKALADLYRSGYASVYGNGGRDAALQRVPDWKREQQGRVMSSSDYLADVMEQVPVHVVPCIVRPLPEATPADLAGFYGSVVPAVWSFQLALRSRGLGSVYTTLHLVHAAEAAELLGIPPNATQVALIPVAYTKGTDFKPATRRPVSDVTYWDSWKTF